MSDQSFHEVGWNSPFQLREYHSGCSVTIGLSHAVWLATQSRITYMPSSCARSTKRFRSSTVPKSGFTAR